MTLARPPALVVVLAAGLGVVCIWTYGVHHSFADGATASPRVRGSPGSRSVDICVNSEIELCRDIPSDQGRHLAHGTVRAPHEALPVVSEVL